MMQSHNDLCGRDWCNPMNRLSRIAIPSWTADMLTRPRYMTRRRSIRPADDVAEYDTHAVLTPILSGLMSMTELRVSSRHR